MRWPILLLPAAAFALAFMPGTARAQSCSATISTVDFGGVALLSTSPVDVTGAVSVTCTGIPALSVLKMCPSIGVGSGGSDSSSRLLQGTSASLRYQLYQDAARTAAWGSVDNPALGTVPAIILSGSVSGTATVTRALYARLFGGQTSVPAGSYTSVFGPNDTLFTYALFLVGATTSCTGFVGTAAVRPGFQPIANPAKSCSVAASDLAFPATGILTAAVVAQGEVTITCTSQTSYAVALDAGRSATSSAGRRMAGTGGATVAYELYRDSARTVAWASGSQAYTGTGTGAGQRIPVYGRVPVQTTPAPGSYSDTVVATISY